MLVIIFLLIFFDWNILVYYNVKKIYRDFWEQVHVTPTPPSSNIKSSGGSTCVQLASRRPNSTVRNAHTMSKRNKDLEAEILTWIYACLGEPIPKGEFEDILKDGVVLCNLMNKLTPGCIKKIQSKGTNFQLMENIQRFQAAAKKYGVPEEEIFQTADLFERRNINQVALSLYAVGRMTQKHPEWTGPSLGPKMAEKHERTFTEEQLRASEGQVNLQMGFNKGASQSGHGGFGNTRHM